MFTGEHFVWAPKLSTRLSDAISAGDLTKYLFKDYFDTLLQLYWDLPLDYQETAIVRPILELQSQQPQVHVMEEVAIQVFVHKLKTRKNVSECDNNAITVEELKRALRLSSRLSHTIPPDIFMEYLFKDYFVALLQPYWDLALDYQETAIFRILKLQSQHPRLNAMKEAAIQVFIDELETPQTTMHATSTSRHDPISPTDIPTTIICSQAGSISPMCPDSNFNLYCSNKLRLFADRAALCALLVQSVVLVVGLYNKCSST